MKYFPEHLLKLVLGRIKGQRPLEIRFISGMAPALVDNTGPHFLEVAYLSQETVIGLHQQCLVWAGQSELASRNTTSYSVAVPKYGRYLCTYRMRGNIASLTFRPDADATELIDAIRPVKRPSLRAEARPEESAPRSKRKH
jgi:hypothetical protein